MNVLSAVTSRFGCERVAVAAALASVVMTTGCDAEPEPGLEEVAQLRPGNGGIRYDTNRLGVHVFSELDTTGAAYRGVVLSEVEPWWGGICVRIWWEDGTLWCEDEDGNVYPLVSLINSIWKLKIGGESAAMTLADLKYDAERDHWLVRFEDLYGEPTCAADENGDHWALLYGDITFDESDGSAADRSDTLHIACTSGILGAAGHKYGWTPEALGGAKHFETAVRTTALDVCGDGTPRAAPDVAFAARDHAGINDFGAAEGSPSEGVFGPEVMLCHGDALRNGAPVSVLKCGGVPVPSCAEPELKQLFFSDSGLIWTKTLGQ